MKTILTLLLLSTTVFSYSLEDLIDSAFKHSGMVANSDIIIAENDSELKMLRADLMPKIFLRGEFQHFGASYDRYSLEDSPTSFSGLYQDQSRGIVRIPDKQDLLITEMLDTHYGDRSFAPKENALELDIIVEQPLFQQGKVLTAIRQNRMKSSMLVCNWQDAHMRVKAEISTCFYGFLLAREKTGVMKEVLEFTKRTHYDRIAAFENGEAIAFDTLTSFLSVVESEERVYQAESELLNAEMALRNYTGLDTADTFNIEGELLPLEYDMMFDSAEVLVRSENKVITRLQGEVGLSELAIEMAKRDYLPSVKVGVEFERLSHFDDVEFFSLEPERKLYLGIRYDLFTAGGRYYKVLQAEQRHEIVKNRLDDSLRDQIIELRRLWKEKELGSTRVKRNKQAVSIAENGYRVAIDLFNAGTLSIDELNRYEQRMLVAKVNYLESVYYLNSTIISIRLITADYLYE